MRLDKKFTSNRVAHKVDAELLLAVVVVEVTFVQAQNLGPVYEFLIAIVNITANSVA